jgi:hypothetical protein
MIAPPRHYTLVRQIAQFPLPPRSRHDQVLHYLKKGAKTMKELRTEIEIQASPEKVWQILTNLDQWPEWNPFIHHALGKAQMGEAVDITFRSVSKEMTLHCTVVKAEPNRELRWKYHTTSFCLVCLAASTVSPLSRWEPIGFASLTEKYSMAYSSPCRPKILIPIQEVALRRWTKHSKQGQSDLKNVAPPAETARGRTRGR